jgi:hypothetical protein
MVRLRTKSQLLGFSNDERRQAGEGQRQRLAVMPAAELRRFIVSWKRWSAPRASCGTGEATIRPVRPLRWTEPAGAAVQGSL